MKKSMQSIRPVLHFAAGLAFIASARCETIVSTGTETASKQVIKEALVSPESPRQEGGFALFETAPEGASIAGAGTIPEARAWVTIRTPESTSAIGKRNGVRFIQQTDANLTDSIQFHLAMTDPVAVSQRVLLIFEKDSWSALKGAGKAAFGGTGEISFRGNNGAFQGGGARFAPVVRNGEKFYIGNEVATIDKKIGGFVDADRISTSFAQLGKQTFTGFDPSAPDFGGLDLASLSGTVAGSSLGDITAVGIFVQYDKTFEAPGANEFNIGSFQATLEPAR
jgi:hypothetical protein